MRSLRKRYDSSIPVLVHCSAGVGRSGVVLIVDLLMAKVDCGEVSKDTLQLHTCIVYFSFLA